MRCNLSGDMCGFLSDHRELDLGSPEISEEKVSNHKLIQPENEITKEMLRCA